MFRQFRLWLCAKDIHWAGWVSAGFDGCSVIADCNLCHRRGLVDSQGNLFGTTRTKGYF